MIRSNFFQLLRLLACFRGIWQRAANRQPGLGLIGLVISPLSRIRCMGL